MQSTDERSLDAPVRVSPLLLGETGAGGWVSHLIAFGFLVVGGAATAAWLALGAWLVATAAHAVAG